mgnify:CR=1 FL=1|tara:strand:- start:131 stop:574 length:444 start_codon:yes stop_codon:yes gene_type:complete
MANPLYGQNKFDDAIDADAKWYQSAELDLTSTAGVYPVFNIPAGSYLLEVRVLVTSAITAGSADIDVGDGDDPDMFIDGWDCSAGSILAGSIVLFGGASGASEAGVSSGKYYSAADTLDVDINTVASAGKIKLLVLLATHIPSKVVH